MVCAACGSSAGQTASSVAGRFLAAAEDADAGAACELLAPKTREELEFGEDGPCTATLASLGLPGGTVDEVEVWGDRARATGRTDTVFLVELGSGWRVAAAGCTPPEDETFDCLLGS
ncbi:hypothetical protein BU204_27370 [Actinophytocola xanthii]|uniref:Uncharacterized protein n=1 Tax=Actinophytocola xanthii TaxID=1912961 RepID=A0A1Q8CGJ4_9PSEU|nr:hypothetical protein BU204_27370 [Actinophytocola xanthii]